MISPTVMGTCIPLAASRHRILSLCSLTLSDIGMNVLLDYDRFGFTVNINLGGFQSFVSDFCKESFLSVQAYCARLDRIVLLGHRHLTNRSRIFQVW